MIMQVPQLNGEHCWLSIGTKWSVLGLCAEILVLCEMGLSNMKMSCNSFAPSVKVVFVKGDYYSHLADGEADIQKADGVPQLLES